MRAEDLLALAAAHGIDLKHVAGSSTRTDGSARQRRRSRQEIKQARGRPLMHSARGTDDAGGAEPAWTIAEIGQAAYGIPQLHWLAACYTFAGDIHSYWPLARALAAEAVQLRREQGWPAVVTDVDGIPRFYCEQLAHLVLDEDANRPFFNAAPQLYALYMRVTESTWEQALVRRFASLQIVYQAWVSSARSVVQRRIMEGE